MWMTRVWSEWDLGINEFYEDEDLARMYVRDAIAQCGIEESLEELEDEGLISYEDVCIVMRPE